MAERSCGLDTGGRVVPPEWIDYNGHMMDAYYFLAFTEATEVFLDHVGLGAAYQARTGNGIYTAESHLCFLSGVTGGADLTYRTQLLGHDEKRMHVFHWMTSADDLAATCELMFLHVSDYRVRPMPPERAAAVAALAAGHASLPHPDRAGRHVAMPLAPLRGPGPPRGPSGRRALPDRVRLARVPRRPGRRPGGCRGRLRPCRPRPAGRPGTSRAGDGRRVRAGRRAPPCRGAGRRRGRRPSGRGERHRA